MNKENPFLPVQFSRQPRVKPDRPYYIYATAVLLLVWVGVYVYLQSQYALSEDGGVIFLHESSSEHRYARRVYSLPVPAVISSLALSILGVNAALWSIFQVVGLGRKST